MPLTSVCVPTWQRQPALDGMFEMYADLYPDLTLQFSIADDGSIPPAVVRGVHPNHSFVLARLPEKDHALNPCVPINAAVNASSGSIIVLTNPEVRHEGPVLSEMFGLRATSYGKRPYITARCYGVGYPGIGRLPLAGPDVDYSTRGRLPVPPGAHFHFLAMFDRELWVKAGGFDEDYRNVQGADDSDWLWRVHRAGAEFRCTEGATWQPKSDTEWNMPHGRDLFFQKWPEALV